jgi:hypothetical protein
MYHLQSSPKAAGHGRIAMMSWVRVNSLCRSLCKGKIWRSYFVLQVLCVKVLDPAQYGWSSLETVIVSSAHRLHDSGELGVCGSAEVASE